ncbi:MAG: hypothetical protein ACRCS8_04775 [Brevinema sp.]
MHVGRFLFILTLVLGYGLLFSDQRMEARDKKLQVYKLQQELELLNARKQELNALIEQERARLVKQSQGMGKHLSPKDIVIVEL